VAVSGARRQRRLLRLAGDQLRADPDLARLSRALGDLAAGEAMPGHEQLPGRASRFWDAIWDALCESAWLAAAMPDPPPARRSP
jgi:hypothetical protein